MEACSFSSGGGHGPSPAPKKCGDPGFVGPCSPGTGGGGGGGGGPTEDPAAAAKKAAEEAKQKLIDAAKALLKIAMDELGITAALDCFTKGDLGACAETALNVAMSFVGGLAGKLLAKYGAPWKWAKGAELVKKVWNALERLVGGVKDWIKNSRLASSLAGGCNSFVPGTLVLLADGSTKPIDELKVGDVVLATDPATGRTEPKPVTATIVGQGSKNLVEITIDVDGRAGSAAVKIVATDGHPFWAPSAGKWIDATDLQPGTVLETADRKRVKVVAVSRWSETAAVYNLTVADIHTYYVLAGSAPVLVHNDQPRNPNGTFASGAGGETADTARGRLTHINYRIALGDGYDYEHRLPSGGRPDAIDWDNNVVRELKSDAPGSQAAGRRQLARYQGELVSITGEQWSTELDTYKRFC